jgi:hypothetical protein
MNGKVGICISAFVALLVTTTTLSNLIFAQLPDTGGSSDTSSLASAPLLDKIRGASSLSNIQVISWVDGIEVTGVNVGETDATITLKNVAGDDNDSKASMPVTVTVLRTPGSSIKSLLALVQASNKLAGKNSTNPLIGIIGQMGGLGGSTASNTSLIGSPAANVSESIKPLQALLQLGKDTQIGVGNIVGGNWEKPRTITTGLLTLGGVLGLEGNPSSEARAHLTMVFVVPYSGKTSFGTVQLH